MAASDDYEKLGVFYLGRTGRPNDKAATRELLLYDSNDLTTHAVCVGMTGSGETGLCIGLLEEALIDGIPALVIDPKGDLTNLLLTFPKLRPEDFAPWVPADEAMRAGVSLEAYAKKVAESWKQDWPSGSKTAQEFSGCATRRNSPSTRLDVTFAPRPPQKASPAPK
jgi:DNA helicase HerA-like ATPase